MNKMDRLIKEGLSPAEAIDYYYVEIEGLTQSAWASERGVNQQSVSQNVRQAKEKLREKQQVDS